MTVVANSGSYGRSVAGIECAMEARVRTMEERSYTTPYGRSVVVTNSTMAGTEEQTQSLWIVATTHGLISGGNGGAKLVRATIQRKLLSINGGNWASNGDNEGNSGRRNLVIANSASYGWSVVPMERTMEERSYTTIYDRKVVVIDFTMAAIEEWTHS